jgi:hypothetical protein
MKDRECYCVMLLYLAGVAHHQLQSDDKLREGRGGRGGEWEEEIRGGGGRQT